MTAIRLAALLLILAGLALSGCTSYQREVVISSSPPGAIIYVNGEERGQTESKVILDYSRNPGARIFVQLRKNHHLPGFGAWTIQEVLERKRFDLEPVP
ncbi:MAG: PEGA domain-containing protein [Planctomycetes bacterium]|nr:PEGA domain-containing protein [Planctomycetota bacterium]